MPPDPTKVSSNGALLATKPSPSVRRSNETSCPSTAPLRELRPDKRPLRGWSPTATSDSTQPSAFSYRSNRTHSSSSITTGGGQFTPRKISNRLTSQWRARTARGLNDATQPPHESPQTHPHIRGEPPLSRSVNLLHNACEECLQCSERRHTVSGLRKSRDIANHDV